MVLLVVFDLMAKVHFLRKCEEVHETIKPQYKVLIIRKNVASRRDSLCTLTLLARCN